MTIPETCCACPHSSPDDTGPLAECGRLGYGLGGGVVHHGEAPPDHCPLRREAKAREYIAAMARGEA